jgi:hypothetical protein
VAVAGLLVGIVVGVTGMGGGALMTPILILFFGVAPLAAVSSDLVVSLLMKPLGGFVHLRRGTVNMRLVLWLCIGSVPSAFAGVLVLRALGDGEQVERIIRYALGVALLVASSTMVVKAYLSMRQHAREVATGVSPTVEVEALQVRPLPTALVGVLGGFVVGMTSVGSGSLIIVALLLLYPTLKASQLVGTDLVQAVPLVGAAALGHALFGDVQLGLTGSLLIGALPGVYLGARVSSSAPQSVVRRALVLVLLASGAKLVGVPTAALGVLLLVLAVVGPLAWMLARHANGLPYLWRIERDRTPESAGTGGPASW